MSAVLTTERPTFQPSAATLARRAALSDEHVAHFLELAERGQRAGARAATGEATAARLLLTVALHGYTLMDLDASAQAGYMALLAAFSDPDARDAAAATLFWEGK